MTILHPANYYFVDAVNYLDTCLIDNRSVRVSHSQVVIGMSEEMTEKYADALHGVESRFYQVMKRNGKV